MAKPHEPNNIKRLKGDPNKNRYLPDGINIEKLKQSPPPPEWLDNRAVDLYNFYSQVLIANKLIAITDINALCHLCKLESAMIKLWERGEVPPMSMYSQYKWLINDFGLTVISRERMPVPKDSLTSNKWAKNT